MTQERGAVVPNPLVQSQASVSRWDEQVLAHGDIRALDARLWQVTGTLPKGAIPRNMTLYRLDDGGLLIHGAQALNEGAMAQLERLGAPGVMIVPSPYHNLHEGLYKERYPALTVLCPAAARDKLARDFAIDGTVEDRLGEFGVEWHGPDGLKPTERVYELPLASGHALLAGDVLMNLPHLPGVDGFLFRLLGSTGFFGMTRIGRMLLLKDKELFRRWLQAQAERPELRLVLTAHGAPIDDQVSELMLQAAQRL